jgi:hypothetical protein
MDRTDSRFAPSPEDSASHTNPQPRDGQDLLDFEPVPLRYRSDGLTPEKQRAYVEALADCGIAREAAARIGVSEQSINRVRRRADARDFDRACEAAQMFGARRLRSIAFQRAIEGSLKGHYYHGELVSQERVYDNRLLTYLLGKTEHLLEPPQECRTICDNWEPHMDALEQGLPPPTGREAARKARDSMPEFDGHEVWEDDDGIWWTEFPPPAGFSGEERGDPAEVDYRRRLSAREQAVVDAQVEWEDADALAEHHARRDRFFGFAGDEISSPGEAEPYEGSETSEDEKEEDRGEGPIEYKSMTPPARPSRLGRLRPIPVRPAEAGTSARPTETFPSRGPGFCRDDDSGASSPPYPHRRFRSIPEAARLWGTHG